MMILIGFHHHSGIMGLQVLFLITIYFLITLRLKIAARHLVRAVMGLRGLI